MVMSLTGRVYMIVIFNLLLSEFLETNVYTSLYKFVHAILSTFWEYFLECSQK